MSGYGAEPRHAKQAAKNARDAQGARMKPAKGPLTITDWYDVGRHGHIAVCDSRTLPEAVYVGDLVTFTGREGVWRIAGIERSRKLTSPPIVSPWIGLRVHRAPSEASA